jgi:3-carboxy-cis,cis-muconate cycloisomerase
MPVRLMESLATTEPLAELFSDQSVVRAMLEFEAALAHAEARTKIVPQAAAKAIAGVAAGGLHADQLAQLAHDTLRAATPGVPLVKALRAEVRKKDPVAAGFVHWGATSQDVCDTALVLLLKKAQLILESDLERLQAALGQLAEDHRDTVMLSRTLLQAALPTTFGLKAAGWLAAIDRSNQRLQAGFRESRILEFGGASGTLAALGDKGVAVGEALAGELGLGYPEAPWHSHRDRLALLLCACGVLCGTLGKMARDISLLAQSEVGEVAEPRGPGRGSSSTMPHKQNPVGCAVTLAAANRVPGLVGSFLSGMAQEHERAMGAWQGEWPVVASVIQATGLAIVSMAEVAEGLIVHKDRMRANIQATRGVIFSERAEIELSGKLGRDLTRTILSDAVHKSEEQKKSLAQVLSEMKEVKTHLDAAALRDLENPDHYLGVAEEFRKRLLDSVAKRAVEGKSSMRSKKE